VGTGGLSGRTQVSFTAEEVARVEFAAGYAAQGPFGSVSPALLTRFERWARRARPVRASLDGATLRVLLALAPLFSAYVEHKRETDTESIFPMAAPPPDDGAALLEEKLLRALARLTG
jgi:hypothetical protein